MRRIVRVVNLTAVVIGAASGIGCAMKHVLVGETRTSSSCVYVWHA